MKSNKTPLAFTIGGTLISGLAATSIQADTFSTMDSNPFEISELSSGYMRTAEVAADKDSTMKKKEGSCGEGSCGSSMMKSSVAKTAEGSCAGNKPMPKAVVKKTEKSPEGKCGEGKCGSM